MTGDIVDGGGGSSGTASGGNMVIGGWRPDLDIDDDTEMTAGGALSSGPPEGLLDWRVVPRFLCDCDGDLVGYRKSVFRAAEDGEPGGSWNSWGGGVRIREEGASGGIPPSKGSSNLVVRTS